MTCSGREIMQELKMHARCRISVVCSTSNRINYLFIVFSVTLVVVPLQGSCGSSSPGSRPRRKPCRRLCVWRRGRGCGQSGAPCAERSLAGSHLLPRHRWNGCRRGGESIFFVDKHGDGRRVKGTKVKLQCCVTLPWLQRHCHCEDLFITGQALI